MSQKKKILFVITQGTWGGAQRYVFDLATGLDQNFEVVVAVGEPNGRKDLQEKIAAYNTKHLTHSIKIVQLEHLVREISPWHDLLAIFELKRKYKEINPNIIHLNSSKAGIIGTIAKLFSGYLLVYTVHGWVFNESLSRWKKTLYIWLEKITAVFKNKIIVLSKEDFIAGKNISIDEKKMVIVPLGIEVPKKILTKDEARNKIASSHTTPRNDSELWIGTIANFYETKGLDVLIEAIRIIGERSFATLRMTNDAKNDTVKFFIIGDGPERKNLENLIAKYSLQEKIFLTGTMENASEMLPAFDLFVLPSRKEGLPYTILEAMFQNVPIVATKVGGIPSIIENKKTGLLVDPERPDLLAEGISYALENIPEMLHLAESAKLSCKEYTLQKMVAGTTSSCY